MHPTFLKIQDFTYSLPEEKIAKFPLEQRDESKLLVYKANTITEDRFYNVSNYLPSNSLVVFNNSRVIEARILFQKPTGGIIEIFTLEPSATFPDITTAMKQKGKVLWNCLIGGASKWKHGQVLQKEILLEHETILLQARITDRLLDSFLVEFCWSPHTLSFAELLHISGIIPLPPYLKRDSEEIDKSRYQTIYAKPEGSVAAPTAGLHFTEKIFSHLKEKNIEAAFVTLHVGAGTFMPVKSPTMEAHHMHAEYIEADLSFINKLIAYENSIFSVGTTSLRTIESLYWMGIKCIMNPDIEYNALEMGQWEVYNKLDNHGTEPAIALTALANWMIKNHQEHLIIKTSILIAPGYKLRMIKGLITNFHQPESTLLLLVAALTGNNWRKIYEYALRKDFRFLSYGDGCLLFSE